MTQHDPSVQPATPCALHRPGHAIHWIQARLTWREPGPTEVVEVLDVTETQLVVVSAAGVRCLWNHDIDRVRALLRRHGSSGTLLGHQVLRLGGGHMVCVADSPIGPCLTARL